MKNPNHIAIIMDGNGRWGQKKLGNKLAGYREGVKNLKPLINFFLKNKIKHLTIYALSYDNLKKRNTKEIENIFNILKDHLVKNLDFFKKNKIFLNFIGERRNLPRSIIKLIVKTSNETKLNNNKLFLNIAFNYSSKIEILNSVKKILLSKKKLSEKNVDYNLYTFKSKDPEIIIRTGAQKRLSDFLLWQSSYSELFFLKKLWPDFKIQDLKIIIEKFKKIKRNFGS